ncbi:MAG: glycosyltransferase [Calditrichaeota bacterium]|nr:glycosyltransferase [Calditrichota bacterium]
MPICIGGMHRSGTSLITKLLHLSGMYLGPEDRLMPPAEDNPEGFWENLDFVRLNDRILAYLGGAWDYAPDFPQNWFRHEMFADLKEKASHLAEDFQDHSFWGWKDPRNTLTFEFWESLVPNLKFILALRDPLEVAVSLHKRNGLSLINGLRLWFRYNELRKDRLNDPNVLVVHYDALLFQPEKELRRILERFGIEVSEDTIQKALSAVRPDLRHQNRKKIGFEYQERYKYVFEFYDVLCEKAEFSPREIPDGHRAVVTVASPEAARRKTAEKSEAVYCPHPVFVVGCHRSGTSVLAHSLARHPKTWLGEESNFIAPIAHEAVNAYKLGTSRGKMHWLPSQNVGFEEFMFFLGLGINALYTDRSEGKRWIEQTPEYTLSLDPLFLMFPGAAFVNIIRDGREVVNSMIHSGFGVAWAKDFQLACQTWVRFVKAGLEFEKARPHALQRVYFEYLKAQPETEFRSLAQKLNLDFEPGMAEFFAKGQTINSSFSSGKKASKKDWRVNWTREQKEVFDRIAGRLLMALGYEKDQDWVRGKKRAEKQMPWRERSAKEILSDAEKKVRITPGTDPSEKKQSSGRVSIIIPVFNKLQFTHRCLKAILQNTRYPDYEVIFADNGSTDDTRSYLQNLKVPNVKAVFNEQNLGYVGGCNSGARHATGDYLLFLNNDTEVQPGWLENLVRLAESRGDCGAVGAKLVYPDGKLQEAGGIIFSDGQGWNYGRGFNPDDPRFNFVRETDYCSGAALMVRKDLWERIGGFDERYAPAYYEDTDLCFAVRKEGYKVYYQPKSVVIHYEGQTAGTDLAKGFKKYQQINRQKFADKWREELKRQYPNDPANVPFASQRGIGRSILVADPFLPVYDRASGSLRLFNYLKILKRLGCHITFIARVASTDPKYKDALQQIGIEVYENDEKALHHAGLMIHKVLPPVPYEVIFKERKFDYAILSFWYIADYYTDVIRRYSPNTKIIVDTVDIHFVREMREAELKKSKALKQKALKTKKDELGVYQKADRIWVVTGQDKKHIEDKIGNVPVDVVPNIHEEVPYQKVFDETRDLLFVGNFAHPPNGDGITYFVKEIFPLVKKSLPDVKLYVVGNNPTQEVVSLAGQDVIVTGFVADLKPYLLKARISISPLRYGAGMKGKVGEALSYGLPVVTTSIGAEGMNLENEKHALIADDPREFARQVVRLYNDRRLWENLSKAGRAHVENHWGPGVIERTLQKIIEDGENKTDRRPPEVSIIMLTFNALEYTKKCVRSILEHTKIPYEIIFVDNGSTDGTVEYLNSLLKEHSYFKAIFNKKNKGFAYGNNQGARIAGGKYLLFLNNDVLVSDGWLNDLVSAIEKDEKIGMVGPITNSISGLQRVVDIPYKDETGFHRFARQVSEVNRNKITPRRRIAGFCMLMPARLFKELKGFDKNFGTGNFEDDDLCIRVRNRKYAIMVHEGVFIHHYGSQTFKANNIRYDQSLQQKARIFYRKWQNVDYEELLELKNPLPEVHRELKAKIQEATNAQDFDQAKKLCFRVLTDNPLDEEALFYLSLAFYLNGEQAQALESAKKLFLRNPENASALNLTGQILMAEKRVAEAEQAFLTAMRIDPGFIDAKRNYADVLIEKGEYQPGIRILNEILENHPTDVITLLYLAQLYFEAERYGQAWEFVRRALKTDAQNTLALQLAEILQSVAPEFNVQPDQAENTGQDEIRQEMEALKE